MTPAFRTQSKDVVVRDLTAADAVQFHELGASSSLHSLINPDRRAELLASGQIIGAFDGRELIGCACVQTDVGCQYIDIERLVRNVPIPNVYLCSAFVRSDRRGLGIGSRLYAARLNAVLSYRKPCVVVEILGTGLPLATSAGAVAGYLFHLAEGFRVVGYSPDEDHGPVLIRYDRPPGEAVRYGNPQMPSSGLSFGEYPGSREMRSHPLFSAAKSASSGARWMLRLSQFCARPGYVASGGWWLLSPLVGGWAVPRPTT